MSEINDTETQKVDEPKIQDSNLDYIDTIKKLKETTVSRDQYDKLVNENKKLLDSVLNGSDDGRTTPTVKERSADEIRHELSKDGLSNLDFVKDSLELRNKLIQEGKPDPFLPTGSKIVPTNEDIEAANRVAQVFQECIDYAQGDSDIFTNELMRRTIDAPVRRSGR